jgi:hypothetical protein
MKNNTIILSWLFLLAALGLRAQSTPQGIQYQASIRDNDGEVIMNQNISLQFAIRQGTSNGTAVYTETHSATTSEFGLVNLTVGQGTTGNNFSAIDWSAGPYFLEISLDLAGGSSYTSMGTTQLLSVPYALYAEKSGTLPSGGTSGQVLSTDGAGNYTWVNDKEGATLPNHPGIDGQVLSVDGNGQYIWVQGLPSGGSAGQVLSIIDFGKFVLPTWVNLIPSGGAAGQVLSTDGSDNYSWADDKEGTTLPPGGTAGQVLSTDGTDQYSWVDNDVPATYAVGDQALGGTVIWVNAEGTHGLVAANQDQLSYVNWWEAHSRLNFPDNHDTDGQKYVDWRLPQPWEMTYMASLLTPGRNYWTSIEINSVTIQRY